MATVAESFLGHLKTLIEKYPSVYLKIDSKNNHLCICDGSQTIRFDGKINLQRIYQHSYTDDPNGLIINPPTPPGRYG